MEAAGDLIWGVVDEGLEAAALGEGLDGDPEHLVGEHHILISAPYQHLLRRHHLHQAQLRAFASKTSIYWPIQRQQDATLGLVVDPAIDGVHEVLGCREDDRGGWKCLPFQLLQCSWRLQHAKGRGLTWQVQ